MSRWRPLLLAPALLLLVGCGGGTGTGGDEPGASRPPAATGARFADCKALAAPPEPAASAVGSAAPVASAAGGLPDIELPCFGGGGGVRLAGIRGPAVLNLWASWCPPCRRELPAFQRFADRTAGRVHVLGVVTLDTRAASASLAEDFDVRFANLFDDHGRLQRALVKRKLAGQALPVTVFVDRAGAVRFVHVAEALDDARLAQLAERHLGVVAR
ncbi:MAG TPA: TlpA disulfide reductase family protein [Pilimelia sp.]|nr:TlpA disulfide reductase family protein [Pilimelia sp.]